MTALLVILGAAVGAPLRYVADQWARRRFGTSTTGTLVVNVAGSFVLGLVTPVAAQGDPSAWLVPLIGIGFCGALTTFSTLAFEVVALWEGRRGDAAAAYLALSLCLGFAAVGGGFAIGSELAG